MGKFIIKKTPTGEFNFHLFASNGEKVAVSSEIYTTKANCKNGIESVIANAPLCIKEDRIEDQTLQVPEYKTCPKFEIYFDKAGMYRYRLRATNGEIIAICEEGYASKNGIKIGMESVANNAPTALIIDETV